MSEIVHSKKGSLGPALAGAAAGVALVVLVALGWWMGEAEAPVEREAHTPASETSGAARVSPHGGEERRAEDTEMTGLRARIAADPEALAPRRLLATRLLRQGLYYGAFEEAQALLARAPEDVDGLFVLASVRVRMGQPSRALPLLDRVLAAKPDHVPALTARGQALLKAGHEDAAIEVWERALALSGGADRQLEELLRSARSSTGRLAST